MARDSKEIKDKYNNDTCLNEQYDKNRQIFENTEKVPLFSVKGSLKRHLEYWKAINTSDFLLDIIEDGYKIPFVSTPPIMYSKNNNSALNESEFVNKAIKELIDNQCVIKVTYTPHVVNPLTVAQNSAGKKRFILDLRLVNLHIRKQKIQFEDYKTASQFFKHNAYMFKWDFRSGYYHIDIAENYRTFLGFQWDGMYYCFTVLPFGLSSAPFIFTKIFRPLVKIWRLRGIDVALYLDDGFGISDNYELAKTHSKFVRESLLSAGVVLNEEKSIWIPTQNLTWLGLCWNSVSHSISVPEARVYKLLNCIDSVIKSLPFISARKLAKFVGLVMSFHPVIGNLCLIMSKYSQMFIASSSSWDRNIRVHNDIFISELFYWKENVQKLNFKKFSKQSVPWVMVFSDASNLAGAAYAVQLRNLVFHKMWNSDEQWRSSTWREMRAILLAIQSFAPSINGKCVKWFTDNQGCVSIVNKGSMKPDLQSLALEVSEVCKSFNIELDIQWIPRELNDLADYYSKYVDCDDWSISKEFFEFMNDMWGPFTIDRFASVDNAKIKRFNSQFCVHGSEGVDAFSLNWANENNWLVPPVRLIVRAIKHCVECQAHGTFIIPKWPSASFWTLIFDEDMLYKSYVKEVLEFYETDRILSNACSEKLCFNPASFKGIFLAIRL